MALLDGSKELYTRHLFRWKLESIIKRLNKLDEAGHGENPSPKLYELRNSGQIFDIVHNATLDELVSGEIRGIDAIYFNQLKEIASLIEDVIVHDLSDLEIPCTIAIFEFMALCENLYIQESL